MNNKKTLYDEDIKEILGSPGNLSENFKLMIEDGFITKDEAEDIQAQLTEEYEIGKVTPDGFIQRLFFLTQSTSININSLAKISRFLGEEEVCPFCGIELEDATTSCNICGYNLEYEGDDEYEDITEEEVKDMMADLLVNMNGMSKQTADILLNPEDTRVYYPEKDKLVNYNDSDIKIPFSFDDGEEFFYKLDESIPVYDNYDICLYKIIQSLIMTDNLDEEIEFYIENTDYTGEANFLEDIVSNGYCSNCVIPEYWDETAKSMEKMDLKKILGRYNLKTSGNKKELIDRIRDNVNLEEIELNSIESLCEANHTIYLLTPRGYEYLENNEYIQLYSEVLYMYHYVEYKNYLKEHSEDNLKTSTIGFLKCHENKAFKEKNQMYYADHIETEANVYKYFEDNQNHFKTLIRLFVAELNPLIGDEILFAEDLVDEITVEQIIDALNRNDYDITKAIKEEYKKITTDIIVPCDVVLKNLPQILEFDDIEGLDESYKKKYLNMPFL